MNTGGTVSPSLLIVKNVNESSFNQVGDILHYQYYVINDGNVTLTGPFSVEDDKAIDESCPPTDTLAPGAFVTCIASYTVTQGDLDAGLVTNVAFAQGFYSGDPVISPTDTETVNTNTQANPALLIVKNVEESSYDEVDDVLHYSYLVINTGNVTLSGPFTVEDDRANDESCPATDSLAPGGSITCTASYTITQGDLDAGSVTNTASAQGYLPGYSDQFRSG